MNDKVKKIIIMIISIIMIIILFFIYCRYKGTKGFKIKEYNVINSNIPESFYGTKVVHISDIHYKSTTDYEDLKMIVNKINLIKPDIVIITGDIFDNNIEYNNKDYDNIKKLLKNIDYKIGKYAIKGEEDLKISKWEEIMNDSEFINLNDTFTYIYNEGLNPIFLVGVSSNYEKNHMLKSIQDSYNNSTDEYKYSILIFHEPDCIDNITDLKFNLALAGHSHGGGIKLPIVGGLIKDKLAKKYYKDFYKIKNTHLYISSGIGTDKHKVRFRNKPSINLYRLRNK